MLVGVPIAVVSAAALAVAVAISVVAVIVIAISFVVVGITAVAAYLAVCIAAATKLSVVGFAIVGMMNITSKTDNNDGSSSNKFLSHAQRFRMKSVLLAEFVALRQRLPEMEMIHPRPIKVMTDEKYDTLSE